MHSVQQQFGGVAPAAGGFSFACNLNASLACRRSVLQYAQSKDVDFWVGSNNALKQLTLNLKSVRDTALDLAPDNHRASLLRPSVIDVGAAAYSADQSRADGSDGLLIASIFGNLVSVIAVEVNPVMANDLTQMASASIANASQYFKVINCGIGGQAGQFALQQRGSKNTWTVVSIDEAKKSSNAFTLVNIRTLDEIVQTEKLGRVFYIKIDIESGTYGAVRSMEKLLRTNSVDMFSFEYSYAWSDEFEGISLFPRRTSFSLKTSEYNGTKLEHLVHWLGRLNYQVYLLATSSDSGGSKFVLLPIYGPFWDDWYELCLRHIEGKWCWHDLIAVNHALPWIKQALFDTVEKMNKKEDSEAKRAFPDCDCY